METDYIDPTLGFGLAAVLALVYTGIEIRIARRHARKDADRG